MPQDMTIPDHYQVKYGDMWEGLLQQKLNRLSQFVTIKSSFAGRYSTVEQIQPIDMERKTSRFQKTEIEDVDTRRRFVFPQTFHKAVGFDEDDGWKLNQLHVPIMDSAMQLMYGANRQMEKIIIDQVDGINKVGDGADEAMTDVILPPSQEVPVDYVETGAATNSDMTIGKLRRALQILQENEAFGQSVDEENLAVCVLSAKQLNSLLRTTEVTSADFAEVKALVGGKIDTAFGYKFVRTEQLNKNADIRNAFVWVKSRVCFGLWDNYKSRLSLRDDLSEATQYRVKFSAGATRIEEKGIVRIFCDESVL